MVKNTFGVFQNQKGEWVQWIHLQEGFFPNEHGWVNQAMAGQPCCWHKLISLPILSVTDCSHPRV